MNISKKKIKIRVIIGTFQINLKLTRFLFQSYYISHILSIFTYEEDKENQKYLFKEAALLGTCALL